MVSKYSMYLKGINGSSLMTIDVDGIVICNVRDPFVASLLFIAIHYIKKPYMATFVSHVGQLLYIFKL